MHFTDLSKLEGLLSCLGEDDQIMASDIAIDAVVDELLACRESKSTVFICGNGGSCAVAAHIANDLVRNFGLSTSSLSDGPTITCIANDYGYDQIYSAQIKDSLQPSDLLICISSSGNSMSIVNAATASVEAGASLVCLSGFDSRNSLNLLKAKRFHVTSNDYGMVEVSHLALLHTIVDRAKSSLS